MPAAMHRSADEREQWNPAESVTPAEALAASTDGQPTLGVRSRGDLVPRDADPPGAAADSAEPLAYSGGMPVTASPIVGQGHRETSPDRDLVLWRRPSPWRELATIDPFTALVPSDSPGGSWNRVTARRCPT
jgi:hypothetical protein